MNLSKIPTFTKPLFNCLTTDNIFEAAFYHSSIGANVQEIIIKKEEGALKPYFEVEGCLVHDLYESITGTNVKPIDFIDYIEAYNLLVDEVNERIAPRGGRQ